MAEAAANPDISYPLGWKPSSPFRAHVLASSEAILAVTIWGQRQNLEREGAGLPSYFWRNSCLIGRIFAVSAENAG
jgi:hypothetical protein